MRTCLEVSLASGFRSSTASSGVRDRSTANTRSAACMAALKPSETHGRSFRAGTVAVGRCGVAAALMGKVGKVDGRSDGQTVGRSKEELATLPTSKNSWSERLLVILPPDRLTV